METGTGGSDVADAFDFAEALDCDLVRGTRPEVLLGVVAVGEGIGRDGTPRPRPSPAVGIEVPPSKYFIMRLLMVTLRVLGRRWRVEINI